MSQAIIIAAAKISDGEGSLASVQNYEQQLAALDIPVHELTIESIADDWHAPETNDRFRSGCGPIEALGYARNLIAQGTPAVVIRGEDLIKDIPRDKRLELMAVYGDDYPLTQGYDDVAQQFIRHQGLDADQFCAIAGNLFENYQRTYARVAPDAAPPGERWFERITSLFRGVDCANPMINFSGAVLLCNAEIADKLEVASAARIAVKGVGTRRLEQDGRDAIETITEYRHLKEAYEESCAEAGIDFADRFVHGEALLDTYTCYPVVPMALLLNSGLVTSVDKIPGFLQEYEITVTGGMNLARAPWNNPALNGLICMYKALTDGEITLGAVHGNGGLGYRQGVAILEKSA